MAQIEQSAPPVTSRRGHFWVGVERATVPGGTVAHGPMYVHWEAPPEVRQPYPVVLIHGGGGQGTLWLTTPDGRSGWADQLVEEGYEVYLVDRPGHGRSALHPDVLGEMGPPFTYETALAVFTAVADGPMAHPDAHLHSQWPGTGDLDDPYLDQFIASTGPMLSDFPAAHALEQARGAELLDRIGRPVILVSTSAGGPAGWLMADARPELVQAVVAVEPLGPPFSENPGLGVTLSYGLASAPLTFDPPVTDPSELKTVTREQAPPEPPLTLQAEPARTLPNLARMPIAMVCAEASPFVTFNRHTVEFLRQAGCDADELRLADHGVHGNGHLMMLEKNNREVLEVILDWLARKAE
jgi:pimeloyl-ACP methyl ester carboxylesterase